MNPGVNQRLPKRDIFVRRGDTYREQFELTDDDGVPLDLTGYVFLSQLRADEESAAVLATFAWSVLGNIAERSLSAAVTALLPTATTKIGVSDAQYTAPSGDVKTFDAANVFFESDVSRP